MKRDGDNNQQNEGGQSDRVEGNHDAVLQPPDDDELSVIQNSIATPVRLRHRWCSRTMDQCGQAVPYTLKPCPGLQYHDQHSATLLATMNLPLLVLDD